jgi:hypothetical protein
MAAGATVTPPGVRVDGLDLPGIGELARVSDGTVPAPLLWAALDAVDETALDDAGLLDLIEAWRRLGAATDARRLSSMARFAATPPAGVRRGSGLRDFADDEIALRTRAGRRAASRDLATALVLEAALPATAGALARGDLDLARAAAVADACRTLDRADAREVESRVLPRALRQDARAAARAAQRAVLAIDPAGAERKRRQAARERFITGAPTIDGMADVWGRLPALDWVTISSAITAAARAVKASGDPRTLQELRADALVAPFAKALRTGVLDGLDPITLARHRGLRPGIEVHVPLSTLAGATDEPGELVGYGPISADLARELAGAGTWRRLVTDDLTGAVLDVGTTTYTPPAPLARLVEARDRTCRFPGCATPATACDLDHTVPFPHGATSATNLHALCRRHHRLKHELVGTGVARAPDGSLVWTLPTGHDYRDHPEPIGIDGPAPP